MLVSKFTRTFLSIIIALVILTALVTLHEPTRAYFDPLTGRLFDSDGVERDLGPSSVHSPPILGVGGGVIMGKLGNETAKQALGRATWKLMHTMTLRFPENPTQDERHALESYFYLQARLYPCGECATEFQQLLKKFPPQTSSRRVTALWLCHVHNQVNIRLKKPEFDCAHLDDTYDCGCGDEPIGEKAPNGGTNKNRNSLVGGGLVKGGR